jgi:hypothetical protein
MKDKDLIKNREHLTKLLLDKSALKQDISDDCEKVFSSFKNAIIKELDALKVIIKDPRIRLSFEDKGMHEIHAYIGSDVLVFNLHRNIFRMADNDPIWGTAYFRANENNGYFGIINIFNFLAESFLQHRINDTGYLIGRIFINQESHFYIEGKGHLGSLFRDTQNSLINDEVISAIVQLAFAYALQFDLHIPPFEYFSEISVEQIQLMGESLKLQTGKRLGFKMKSEELENN